MCSINLGIAGHSQLNLGNLHFKHSLEVEVWSSHNQSQQPMRQKSFIMSLLYLGHQYPPKWHFSLIFKTLDNNDHQHFSCLFGFVDTTVNQNYFSDTLILCTPVPFQLFLWHTLNLCTPKATKLFVSHSLIWCTSVPFKLFLWHTLNLCTPVPPKLFIRCSMIWWTPMPTHHNQKCVLNSKSFREIWYFHSLIWEPNLT